MNASSESVFYAKTWYLYVGAFVFTFLAVFSAIMGPLFLFDVLKRADGKPGTEGGVALSIMSVPMILVAILGWFNVCARRKPLLRIWNEGIEINVIGASSLDGVPLVPTMIRVAWLICTMQGFRKQIGWIPWSTFRSAEVSGLPMVRILTIDATIAYPTLRDNGRLVQIGDRVVFRDADFRVPLDTVASAINRYFDNPETRNVLPSLRD